MRPCDYCDSGMALVLENNAAPVAEDKKLPSSWDTALPFPHDLAPPEIYFVPGNFGVVV